MILPNISGVIKLPITLPPTFLISLNKAGQFGPSLICDRFLPFNERAIVLFDSFKARTVFGISNV